MIFRLVGYDWRWLVWFLSCPVASHLLQMFLVMVMMMVMMRIRLILTGGCGAQIYDGGEYQEGAQFLAVFSFC